MNDKIITALLAILIALSGAGRSHNHSSALSQMLQFLKKRYQEIENEIQDFKTFSKKKNRKKKKEEQLTKWVTGFDNWPSVGSSYF